MHPNYYFSPLAIALALGLSSTVKAAEPVSLQKADFTEIQNQFSLIMPGTVKAQSVLVDSLHFIKQHTDKNKMTHVRMQQTYAGFKVHGGYAIMHSLNKADSLAHSKSQVTMNGVIYKGLQAELGQPKANFVANGKTALDNFKSKYAANSLSNEQVLPMVYVDQQNRAHWAYKVSVLVQASAGVPSRPTAIIDAETNKPFVQWNDIQTIKVNGMGYGGNTKTGFYQYGKDLPLLEMRRDPTAQICFMETRQVKVIDMEHDYIDIRHPMRFACREEDHSAKAYFTGYSSDGYDKINGAASPSNDAMYAGYVINHLYSDWYDEYALSDDYGRPMQLVMRVHYGEAYENAFWDGEQMTFGDGDYFMYPLVSLGVAAHEISHGFTEQHSGLEYYEQSGGINESFSDMAAQAAEFYSAGKNSWQIGPEIMKEDSGYEALRYMDLPSKDGASIDTADEYFYGLDVHFSSGVYNHLFYILANQFRWDVRKAFDVMVKANMDYWTPNVTFAEAACGVLSAAKDLGYPLVEVKNSLDQVKINYESCSAI